MLRVVILTDLLVEEYTIPLSAVISNIVFEIIKIKEYIKSQKKAREQARGTYEATIVGKIANKFDKLEIKAIEGFLDNRLTETEVELHDENETAEKFPTACSHSDKHPSRIYQDFRNPEYNHYNVDYCIKLNSKTNCKNLSPINRSTNSTGKDVMYNKENIPCSEFNLGNTASKETSNTSKVNFGTGLNTKHSKL
ncbi:hypothetical protein BB560_006930 [Smittium megazygosporum]|uniref:Uncharacterized protein n=1 Tax=Smittium megazygosporum TaxID=133381 RepID=A0A2T9Y049_9FUNG|nr:hypothetical protein BB560_006930 [Smittium megazygosporum]